jgi:hypothetical protein
VAMALAHLTEVKSRATLRSNRDMLCRKGAFERERLRGKVGWLERKMLT